MNLSSKFRFESAGGVKPPTSLERQVERLVPSLMSKVMSELSPEADVMDVM